MRWLTHTLAGLLLLGTLAVALAGAALWLVATMRALVGRSRACLRAQAFTIGRVNGSLLGGLVVEDVRLGSARRARHPPPGHPVEARRGADR